MRYTHRVQYTEEDVAQKIMELANTFDPVRMPSRKEIEEYYGNTSLTNKIARSGGHYHWAKKLGLKTKNSDTKLGIYAESVVAEVLVNANHDVQKTALKFPYDLLVDGCVKIDVKAANISYVHGSKVRAYRLAKKQQTCDLYILCEVNDSGKVGDMYVVPSSMVSGQVQVEMGTASTIYEKYKNRFDLIDKMVGFYKSIEQLGILT